MIARYASQIQFGIRTLMLLAIWVLFSNIAFSQFFLNHELLKLGLLGLPLAALFCLIVTSKFSRLSLFLCDTLICILGLFFYVDNHLADGLLLLIDFGAANLLALTHLVDEPHCQWIIYGVINGSGIVFLFNISYHHYFSLVSLMYITLLIFANIFFSFPAFMKKNNQSSLWAILVVILIICFSLSISFTRILGISIILAFYLFFELRAHAQNEDKHQNISLFCQLLFALITFA
ncbi:MAG: hypothetical protein LKF37_12660 [Lentilactobacillus diolivorans]|nr:hypothetical protein [Lentilactobacillus diolivorans]